MHFRSISICANLVLASAESLEPLAFTTCSSPSFTSTTLGLESGCDDLEVRELRAPPPPAAVPITPA